MDRQRAAVGQWVDVNNIRTGDGGVLLQAMNVVSGLVLRQLHFREDDAPGARVEVSPLTYVPGNVVFTDGTFFYTNGPTIICLDD